MKDKNFLTLTEEDGNEQTYEIIDECVIEGKTYVAITSTDYYVLKKTKTDKKEDTFETVEGKELEKVCGVFDARINIIDHDEE